MNFQLGESIQILEATPRLLRAWLPDLAKAWLDADEGPDTWSPYQIVAHLLEAEKSDWIPRLRTILDHGASTPLPPFDRFAHLREPRLPTAQILDEFARRRQESLATLREVVRPASGDLDRAGLHPELGPVTVRQLLSTWTVHDLAHTAQIARVLARRYTEDVGPWATYLRILNR